MSTSIVQKTGKKPNEKVGSVYLRLSERFRKQIDTQEWKVNGLIPTEYELCQQYSVSRETIRKALKTLEEEGLLVAEQGKGRTVAERGDIGRVKTKNIGIICAAIDDTYGEFAAIQNLLSAKGFNLLVYSVGDVKSNNSVRSFDAIRLNQIDGLLAYCQQIEQMDIAQMSKVVPTVSLFHHCEGYGIPSCCISMYSAAFEAVSHLHERGYHKHALLLYGRPYFGLLNAEIIAGYRYGQQNYPADKENIFYIPNIEESTETLNPLIEQIKNGEVDGVISYLNWPATVLCEKASEMRISIPQELGVVALLDSYHLYRSPISITAIEQPRIEACRDATKWLLDILEKQADMDNANTSLIHKLSRTYFGKLIPRDSTLR